MFFDAVSAYSFGAEVEFTGDGVNLLQNGSSLCAAEDNQLVAGRDAVPFIFCDDIVNGGVLAAVPVVAVALNGGRLVADA